MYLSTNQNSSLMQLKQKSISKEKHRMNHNQMEEEPRTQTKITYQLLKEFQNIFDKSYSQASQSINLKMMEQFLSNLKEHYFEVLKGLQLQNGHLDLLIKSMLKLKIQLKDLQKISTTKVYRVKYFDLRPETVLAFLITELTAKPFNYEKSKLTSYSLQFTDGQKGEFKIILSHKRISSNKVSQEEIKGSIVQYHGLCGFFWNYQEWQYHKYAYIQHFDSIISIILQ